MVLAGFVTDNGRTARGKPYVEIEGVRVYLENEVDVSDVGGYTMYKVKVVPVRNGLLIIGSQRLSIEELEHIISH